MSEFGGGLPQIHEKDHDAVKVIKKIDRVIYWIELGILSAALAFLVVLGFYRSLFESTKRWAEGSDFLDKMWGKLHGLMREPPEWTTPTILILVFVVGMLGLCLAAYSERLIAIDVFSRRFKPRLKLTVRILGNLFTIVVLYYFILGALYFRRTSLGIETSSAGRLVSNYRAVLVFPIVTGLVMLHLFLKALMDTISLATGKIAPQPSAAEETMHHSGVDGAAIEDLKAKEPGEDAPHASKEHQAPPADEKEEDDKKPEKPAEAKPAEAKKDEPKKDEAKKDDDKKDDDKKGGDSK